MKKILFVAILIVACAFPHISHAQIDAKCWLEQDCYNARKDLFKMETPKPTDSKEEWGKVFRQDKTTRQLCEGDVDAAGNKIGFCLPTTVAKTKISIGGVTQFAGLAEFVAFIYKYGMSVAGVLAVLMIIFAGVQWTISGGNTEAISSAQHKIYGAVIGLIVLAAAYTILYTVNPDLVNLRPPNIWMINTQKISAPYCGELKGDLISKNPSNPTGQTLTTAQKQAGFNAVPGNGGWVPPNATNSDGTLNGRCGNDYFVQKTGALLCTGTNCESGTVCFDKEKKGLNCYTANIAGKVTNSNTEDQIVQQLGAFADVFGNWIGGRQGWKFPWIYSSGPFGRADILLYVVCQNGKSIRVGGEQLLQDPKEESNQIKDVQQNYALGFDINRIDEANTNECTSNGGTKGFVIAPNFHEVGVVDDGERHFIGRMTATDQKIYLGIDLGDVGNASGNLDNDCILKQAPAAYFFSAQELKDGFILNINTRYISDINDDEDRTKAYKDFLKLQQC